MRIYADGQVGIVFYTSDQQVTFNGQVCANLFAYGQTLRPLEIKSTGKFSMLVAYLQPVALHAYFGFNAAELTDGCVDFEEIDKSLMIRLRSAVSWQDRRQLLTGYLLMTDDKLHHKTDPGIFKAAAEILSSGGGIRPGELHRRLYMTERTFERRFLAQVGVTPAAYCKVCRFKSALQLLENSNGTNLTSVAYHTGYSDQSHFIRNFREFTTFTPKQYLLALNRTAR
jgi:AraC-like DNA-binding protein